METTSRHGFEDSLGQIRSSDAVASLMAFASGDARLMHVAGLWGTSAPLLMGWLAEEAPGCLLYLTPRVEEADHILDDVEAFCSRSCALFPSFEVLPEDLGAGGEIEAERFRVLSQLSSDNAAPCLIVAPVMSLLQIVPAREALLANQLSFAVNDQVDPVELIQWCVDRGYERLDLVESPGDVARRGDIVDIFPPGRRATGSHRVLRRPDRIRAALRCRIAAQRRQS